ARQMSAPAISGSMASLGPARRFAPPSLTNLVAERGDIGRVTLGPAAEHGGSGDENVCACIDRKSRGLLRDATINFQRDSAPAPGDSLGGRLDFLQLAVDEFLAAETGIDRHDQNEIDQIEQIVDRVDGG